MLRTVVLVAGLSFAALAQAQVVVSEAWARATVVGQKGSGAFMKITAPAGATLLGGASPVAGVVEIHEMSMEGNVMKMRALPKGLPLPAGKPVELKPGGFHMMLMDLKEPLKDGSQVKLELSFTGTDGKPYTQTLEVPVRMAPPAAHK